MEVNEGVKTWQEGKKVSNWTELISKSGASPKSSNWSHFELFENNLLSRILEIYYPKI